MHNLNNTAELEGRLHSYLGDITVYHRNKSLVIRGRKVTQYHDANNLVQVYNRLRTGNLTAFACAVKKHFAPYWEERVPNRAYYHHFISANASARPYGLIINKEKNTGAAVVSDYIVTRGSLPSVSVDTTSLGPTHGITDILIGELDITPSTTLGALSRALVENNGGRFAYDDVLAFICVHQIMENGVPRVSVSSTTISLVDTEDYTLDGVSLLGLGTTDHRLSIRGTAPIGGYTWVHARPVPRTQQCLVSSQRLVLSDRTLFDIYASPEQMRRAAIEMKAVIPEQVSPAFYHQAPMVYQAFGVPCSSLSSKGVSPASEISLPDASSPLQQIND